MPENDLIYLITGATGRYKWRFWFIYVNSTYWVLRKKSIQNYAVFVVFKNNHQIGVIFLNSCQRKCFVFVKLLRLRLFGQFQLLLQYFCQFRVCRQEKWSECHWVVIILYYCRSFLYNYFDISYITFAVCNNESVVWWCLCSRSSIWNALASRVQYISFLVRCIEWVSFARWNEILNTLFMFHDLRNIATYFICNYKIHSFICII